MSHIDAEVHQLVEKGLQALVEEAHRCGALAPPYGRIPLPDPNALLDDAPPPANTGEASNAALDEDPADSDSDILAYKFDYGFNPLTWLGSWLQANNPALEKKRNLTQQELRTRGARAIRRDAEQRGLARMAQRSESGVMFGPWVTLAGSNSALLWAKAAKPGALRFCLWRCPDDVQGEAPEEMKPSEGADLRDSSTDSTHNPNGFKGEEQVVEVAVDRTGECAGTARFNGLVPGATYAYSVRLALFDESAGPTGADDAASNVPATVTGSFRTLAQNLEGAGAGSGSDGGGSGSGGSACFAVVSCHQCQVDGAGSAAEQADESVANNWTESVLEEGARFCVVLGDLKGRWRGQGEGEERAGSSAGADAIRSRYRRFHSDVLADPALSQAMAALSFLMAWDDPRPHAASLLAKEVEVIAVAQAAQSGSSSGGGGGGGGGGSSITSRHRSLKAMELDIEECRSALHTLADYWPISPATHADGLTLQTAVTLSRHAQLFLLDARGGMVGPAQALRLRRAVAESSCTWNLVACGAPAFAAMSGCHNSSEDSGGGTATSIRSEVESGNAATAAERGEAQLVDLPSLFAQVHADGGRNVVALTAGSSMAYAASLFGSEMGDDPSDEAGRYPVIELGCGSIWTSSGVATYVVLPVNAKFLMAPVAGKAATIRIGEDGVLSFGVYDAAGRMVQEVTLRPH